MFYVVPVSGGARGDVWKQLPIHRTPERSSSEHWGTETGQLHYGAFLSHAQVKHNYTIHVCWFAAVLCHIKTRDVVFAILIYSLDQVEVTNIPLDGGKKLKDGPDVVSTKQPREGMEESGI